jgi:TatD DNase family protein
MLLDAHNHLHDARLAPWRSDILRALDRADVRAAVVNGTREDDWAQVAALASEFPWVVPSFGLHPWYVANRTPQWRERLRGMVDAHPECGIGEIGLDRWIEGYDFPAQIECFTWQLELAAERNLPATIHCLRAWGALWDIVRERPVPARGFLLHAYGGPAEMVDGFVARGAYFSFSPYFLYARKGAQRDVFRAIPADRLLVETDAPDLAPPPERNAHPLPDHEGKVVNHPANLTVAYDGLAEIRGWTIEGLSSRVTENYGRLFGRLEATKRT